MPTELLLRDAGEPTKFTMTVYPLTLPQLVTFRLWEWGEERADIHLTHEEAARLRDYLHANLGDPASESGWLAHPDGGWTVGSYGGCRTLVPGGRPRHGRPVRRGCGLPSVASLLRGNVRPVRFGYCERHLADFGRLVRGSEVWWDPDAAAAYLRTLPG